MRRIRLTSGKYALVDNEDFKYLSQFRWYQHAAGYAVRNAYVPSSHYGAKDWKRSREYMHSMIVKAPKGLEIDHINQDKLDNRKKNLRIVTHRENSLNRPLFKNNKSGYRGICWDKSHNRWRAQKTINGRVYHLGRSSDKDFLFRKFRGVLA